MCSLCVFLVGYTALNVQNLSITEVVKSIRTPHFFGPFAHFFSLPEFWSVPFFSFSDEFSLCLFLWGNVIAKKFSVLFLVTY